MPTQSTSVPERIIVHPLVLLSVVDHYNRVAKNTRKRVLGALLGQWQGNIVNVANSFAIPFEEDEKDSSVWFLDHDYVESMFTMFKKVNAKEVMVGWYHSGPKLRGCDLNINALFQRFTPAPVLIIVDVQPATVGLPIDAYFAIEEIQKDGTATTKTFVHVPSGVEAEEAEEIGVEHLLRDVQDDTSSPNGLQGNLSLTVRCADRLRSLRGLRQRLGEIHQYLGKVLQKTLPVNHQILFILQDIFNLLPNVATDDMRHSFTVQTNDEMLAVYLASLVRAVVALHGLIDNKLENSLLEKNAEGEMPAKEEAKNKS